MTADEIKILVAIRSLQPTNSRVVADHLNKSHSWLLHRLYSSISPEPGLIERGYVITTGTNTLRLTERGLAELIDAGFDPGELVKYRENGQTRRGEVVRYESQGETGTGRLVDSRAVYEVGK